MLKMKLEKLAFRAVDTGGKGCVETQNFYF